MIKENQIIFGVTGHGDVLEMRAVEPKTYQIEGDFNTRFKIVPLDSDERLSRLCELTFDGVWADNLESYQRLYATREEAVNAAYKLIQDKIADLNRETIQWHNKLIQLTPRRSAVLDL